MNLKCSILPIQYDNVWADKFHWVGDFFQVMIDLSTEGLIGLTFVVDIVFNPRYDTISGVYRIGNEVRR